MRATVAACTVRLAIEGTLDTQRKRTNPTCHQERVALKGAVVSLIRGKWQFVLWGFALRLFVHLFVFLVFLSSDLDGIFVGATDTTPSIAMHHRATGDARLR